MSIQETRSISIEAAWQPQPGPQQALVECELSEVFLGGARGGGKTDGVLGKWALKDKRYGRHFNAIALRRSAVSFADAIERSREIYGPLGGKFNESKLTWRMPNGGRVSFAYLENVGDALAYQGRNVTDVWVEECGQYAGPEAIDRLFGVLRSAHGVPTQMVLTGNPGGPGQHWIAARYRLIPFPHHPRVIERVLPNGKRHKVAVIPARIRDNRVLLQKDPGYVDRLQLVGGPKLVKAWIEGDWTAVEGAFFDCWSEAKHVLRPVELPREWIRYRAADWGSASPFAVYWFAAVQDTWQHPDGPMLPRGALVAYREWYGTADPSASGLRGLKLTAQEVGQGIVKRERGDPRLAMGVLDPSAFAEDGGPSQAEGINTELIRAKLAPFRKGDNRRVTAVTGSDKRGPMAGWDQMRARLVGDGKRPMLYFFATSVAAIRTLPMLQHDPLKAEDLDTDSEDHAADAVRYACMARPWLKRTDPDEVEKRDPYQPMTEHGSQRDIDRSVKLL